MNSQATEKLGDDREGLMDSASGGRVEIEGGLGETANEEVEELMENSNQVNPLVWLR